LDDSFCGITENTVLICKRRETPQPPNPPSTTTVENNSTLPPDQSKSTKDDPKYASIAFLNKLRKMREEITNESKATTPLFSSDYKRSSNIRSPSELSIHSVQTAYDDSECNFFSGKC
jgi:hypothetical protein